MAYTKGQIVKLELGNDKRNYLVLKADGDIIELLCLYSLSRFPFGNSQNYFGSVVDNYLDNDFYKSLSKEAQKAIIPQSITQYTYEGDSSNSSSSHPSYADYSTK